MPRITPVNAANANPDVAATLGAIKTKVGMIPNLHATFANAPAALKGYLGFSEALTSGVLTAKQRGIVSLAVGQANQCQYCLSAHTLIGKGAGLSPDAIRAARQGTGIDAADAAVAALAVRLIETRGQVNDADLAEARSAGLDDAAIIEVVANVALNVLTNFTNNVAATDIDFPVVELTIAN